MTIFICYLWLAHKISDLFAPAISRVVKTCEIQYPVNHRCCQRFKGSGFGLKRGRCRTNYSAGFGDRFHILNMNEAVRCFSNHEN